MRNEWAKTFVVVGPEWSLADLATTLAAWETDEPHHAVSAEKRNEVYVSLYHAHVPRLVELDVIRFDGVSETIRAGPHARQVLTALEGIGARFDGLQEEHARDAIDADEE